MLCLVFSFSFFPFFDSVGLSQSYQILFLCLFFLQNFSVSPERCSRWNVASWFASFPLAPACSSVSHSFMVLLSTQHTGFLMVFSWSDKPFPGVSSLSHQSHLRRFKATVTKPVTSSSEFSWKGLLCSLEVCAHSQSSFIIPLLPHLFPSCWELRAQMGSKEKSKNMAYFYKALSKGEQITHKNYYCQSRLQPAALHS